MSEESKDEKKPEEKKPQPNYRRRRLIFILLVLFIVWWFNNFTLKTTKLEISSDKVRNSLRIAVISDLHATSYGISNSHIIDRICSKGPDLVAVLGDMYTTDSSQDKVDIAVDLIKGIVDNGFPVYVVTGEHDLDEKYIAAVESTGARMMNYKEEIVEINGDKLQIMGIDNVYYSSTFDLSHEFMLRDDCFSLLLAHIPNYDKFSAFGADLTLCADTHGEMVQLPFDFGPLYSSKYKSWVPQILLDEEIYDKGMFYYKGGGMFITSGLGTSPAPIRFNNRPEIAIIDVVPD